jgi:hypothetical protein
MIENYTTAENNSGRDSQRNQNDPRDEFFGELIVLQLPSLLLRLHNNVIMLESKGST